MKIISFILRYAALTLIIYLAYKKFPLYFTLHNLLYLLKYIFLLLLAGFSLWLLYFSIKKFLIISGWMAERKEEQRDEALVALPVKPHLNVKGRKGKEEKVYLEKPVYILGRSSACDVIVDDTFASRRHCRIYKKDSKFLIRDERSRNGTFINDVSLKEDKQLENGDIITLGSKKEKAEFVIEFMS